MNKIEIEKKIDFLIEDWWYNLDQWQIDNLKQFIFETIIPEVLNSVLERPFSDESNMMCKEWYSECIEQIKQKAKELFNINL